MLKSHLFKHLWAGYISCSDELSMKYFFIISELGLHKSQTGIWRTEKWHSHVRTAPHTHIIICQHYKMLETRFPQRGVFLGPLQAATVDNGLPRKSKLSSYVFSRYLEVHTVLRKIGISNFSENCYVRILLASKNVKMTRKFHNHTLLTKSRHREEEAKNNNSHMTSRRQYK